MGDIFLVTFDEPWRLKVRKAQSLALVEFGIMERRYMFYLGNHPGRDTRFLKTQCGAEYRTDLLGRRVFMT
jgi:hypothetical protein